jgi:hypothetical protein
MRWNRRSILKSLGLASLGGFALPSGLDLFVDPSSRMRRSAVAQDGAAPSRLVVFHWPQGVPSGWNAQPGFWYPESAGPLRMTRGLAPLDRHRDAINLVMGLGYGAIHGGVGSHGHAVAVFTGRPAVPVEPGSANPISQGPSVDQLAASRIGGATRFRSIATYLYEDSEEYWWSWSGAGVRNVPETDPARLFGRLFSGAAGGMDEGAGDRDRRRRSILDRVRTEIETLQGELGRVDRERLDQHLTAVRELERTLDPAMTPMPSSSCSTPVAPVGRYTDAQKPEYARVMMDLVAMALRCDLTRVAQVSLGRSQNYDTHPYLGIDVDYHEIVHGDLSRADPRLAVDYYERITLWHMEQVAYFLDLLRAADMGGEDLLGSTAFVATSEFSDGGLHHDQYLPVIAAGRLGGMTGGRVLAFPCDQPESWQEAPWCAGLPGRANRCITDLWQSALTAVGALEEGEVFGDPGIGTEPLPGLWG